MPALPLGKPSTVAGIYQEQGDTGRQDQPSKNATGHIYWSSLKKALKKRSQVNIKTKPLLTLLPVIHSQQSSHSSWAWSVWKPATPHPLQSIQEAVWPGRNWRQGSRQLAAGDQGLQASAMVSLGSILGIWGKLQIPCESIFLGCNARQSRRASWVLGLLPTEAVACVNRSRAKLVLKWVEQSEVLTQWSQKQLGKSSQQKVLCLDRPTEHQHIELLCADQASSSQHTSCEYMQGHPFKQGTWNLKNKLFMPIDNWKKTGRMNQRWFEKCFQDLPLARRATFWFLKWEHRALKKNTVKTIQRAK